MFVRKKKAGNRTYVQIVENRREDGQPRQRVIATLGRLDRLEESGELEGLVRSAVRLCEGLLLLQDRENDGELSVSSRPIGPTMVFERLWRETGCQQVIAALLEGRKFEFDVERAIFLTVLHRLFDPGSDRAADKWQQRWQIPGADEVKLHHLYRAMAWLGEKLPASEQSGRTPFAPRTTKDRIEEDLFELRRDLFSQLGLILVDTTSLHFCGEGGESIGRRGHSKDHRPDLKQMVVAAIVDHEGNPICCELWPGNTTDVKSLVPIVDRLRARFGIDRICVVADRGMFSQANIRELDERGWSYILGARMRRVKEVRDKVLARPGRYQVVHPPRSQSKDPAPLKVKEVIHGVSLRLYDGQWEQAIAARGARLLAAARTRSCMA